MKVKQKDLDRYFKIFRTLKENNMVFADIARALNITQASVCLFSYGLEKSKRFDNWVKENLGLEL